MKNQSMQRNIRYRFGQNWKEYLKDHFNEENVALAKKSLQQVFKLTSFEGKTFLDIGCGSGLFSYAALQLGAKRVFSFDFDKDSVECCLSLKENAGNPGHWDVTHGSILDDEFVAKQGQFDLVYSFGVLHHTGNMWKAIENASRCVRKKGLFYFTIYNKVEYRTFKQYRGSYFWLRVKRAFNTNRFYRALILAWYVPLASLKLVLNWVITGKTPFRQLREYGRERGMSWYTDIHDWLGGYPYEFARADELFRFCKNKLGLRLEDLDMELMNCLLVEKE